MTMNKFEAICREFLKGCSITTIDRLPPTECEACTRAFMTALNRAVEDPNFAATTPKMATPMAVRDHYIHLVYA